MMSWILVYSALLIIGIGLHFGGLSALNKNLYSPRFAGRCWWSLYMFSYILFMAGAAGLFMSFMWVYTFISCFSPFSHHVVDVMEWRKPFHLFKCLGMNSIFIFFMDPFTVLFLRIFYFKEKNRNLLTQIQVHVYRDHMEKKLVGGDEK